MLAISIIIPNREDENPYETLKSLAHQVGGAEVIIVYDEGKGANWARNRGAELATGEYLLFSDNDIIWGSEAVEDLYWALETYADAGYAYGWYEMDGVVYCKQPFSETILRKRNYISTMSMIRRKLFPGFDESLQRLQDWDIWLTLLEGGVTGVYSPHQIFTTRRRDGITFGNNMTWEKAREIVIRKHGLEQ